MKNKYICLHCNKHFFSWSTPRKFCSRSCCSKYKIGVNATHWKGGQIKRICAVCSKVFFVDPHVVKKGYGTFCSRSCTGKRTYGRKIAPKKKRYCVVCNKIFYEYVSALINEPNRGKCCSKECRIKYHKKLVSGKLCYRWRGGITEKNKLERSQMETRNWSRAVKVRDNFTCQLCGIRGFKGLGRSVKLHSHHIKSWKYYPNLRYDLKNGLTLCNNCHRNIVHKALQKKERMAESCLKMLQR